MNGLKIKIISLIIVFAGLFSGCQNGDVVPVPGHAHNDYENEHPLHDALEYSMVSVETDVHLIDGKLYVSHDRPRATERVRTLQQLYLDPLLHRIIQNDGRVYAGYDGPFFLMIDIKSDAEDTYNVLKDVLHSYQPMLSVYRKGKAEDGPVRIIISGNRPVKQILNDDPSIVALDGRPGNLGKSIPLHMMPVVSDSYSNWLSWNGSGKLPARDAAVLDSLIDRVHAENRKLRLWGAPDHPHAWQVLLDHGVDLINTDHPAGFRAFVDGIDK